MTAVHTLYIVRTPHEINGRLCSHEGRICLIVPNYTEVTAEPVHTKDDSVKCYQIEVKVDEVLQQQDGNKQKLLLWLGDTHARSRPQDMLTLPITSLTAVGGGASVHIPGALTPRDAAAALFAGYSDEMKLAGVLSSIAPETLVQLPKDTMALKVWAGGILAASGKAAAAGAG